MAESLVNNLPICNTLDPATLASIAKICVFMVSESDEPSLIYISNDDDVFAMGGNECGCLGLGDELTRVRPDKIVQLCQKQTKDIVYGDSGHVLAVTERGKLFSWGNNEFAQLGNGNMNHCLAPSQVTTNLYNKRVIQAACGAYHSMVLTNDGEIFAWGDNIDGQIGSGSLEDQLYPRRVAIGTATSIACGWSYSVALLYSGKVYVWGSNDHGQLGIDTTDNQLSPCKVEVLLGAVITKIVCGPMHTLALSDKGYLYSWGCNEFGQLGTGHTSTLLLPQKINFEERFIEIAASHWSNISAGLTQTGKVLMWGYCDGKYITFPFLTEVSATDDIFVLFSSYKVTWRMYSLGNVEQNPGPVASGSMEQNPGPVASVWPNLDDNPLDVKVTKCDIDDPEMNELFNNTDEVYSMKGKGTGVRVLIVNNETFKSKARDTNRSLDKRKGTDCDVKSLQLLFTQLGYKSVKTVKDLTGQGILAALKREARNCRRTDNAFICVILSHGTIGSVYGVDGQPVKLKDIWNQFNGHKCPNLAGIPKIFFIQACQGEQTDAGGGDHDTASTSMLNDELAGLSIDELQADSEIACHPMADIFVATATAEGYVSWRNANKGSWFIQALVDVIQNYAYKYDLNHILTKTNALIGDQATMHTGYRQTAEKRDTFKKLFYFFPGFEEQGVKNIRKSCPIS